MQCEICGTDTPYPKTIMLEGTRVSVCNRCVSHGTLVRGAGDRTHIYKRSRYKREEQFDISSEADKLIRDARSKKGWKQDELAKKINESSSVIAHLEAGKLTPSKKLAEKLEKVLGIKLIESVSNERVEIEQTHGKAITLGDIVRIKKR